jgi:hypothetical protein
MSKKNRLTFRLKGSAQDGELVRAEDFAEWLDGVLGCLKELGADLKTRPVLTVTDLAIGSAVLEIEISSPQDEDEAAGTLSKRFAEGYDFLQTGRLGSAGYPPETRRAFERLLRPLRRQLRVVEFRSNGNRLTLQAASLPDIREGRTESTAQVGRIAGYVDAINVHSTPVFYLYPTTGPKRVKCTFDLAHLTDVRDSLKRYTTVSGLLEYPQGSAFPDSVAVDSVRPSPPVDSLPTLASLWGASPGLAAKGEAVALVRGMRDADE